jgi:DNA replication factor GINS
MNLDELQSVRSKERRTDSLQHLRDSFYEDVRAFLNERKAERDTAAEQTADPFADPDVRQITDEIESAKEVVEAIYDRRMGKLVKHASLVAAGMDPNEEGMTTEERELFFDLVDRIQENKETVVGRIDEDGEIASDGLASDGPTDATDGVNAADVMFGTEGEDTTDTPSETNSEGTPDGHANDGTADRDSKPAPPDGESEPTKTGEAEARSSEPPATENSDAGPPAPESGPEQEDQSGQDTVEAEDRIMVRITADVGEILGVDDRAYDLEKEDVVTLPRQNAEPLLEREAAERLE